MSIHETIYNQLGGRRFAAMTGSKNFCYSAEQPNYLQMRLSRNKAGAQFLKITLNSLDLYDLEFGKMYGKEPDRKYKVVQSLNGIYADQLQEVFTQVTGLYTKF